VVPSPASLSTGDEPADLADRAVDGCETEPGSGLLGREEGLEHAPAGLGIHAGPRVADGDDRVLARRGPLALGEIRVDALVARRHRQAAKGR
jgi:hypothetical protein